MTSRFRFERREHCACGGALVESDRIVEKSLAWGRVTFLRCPSCGSWCQSPAVSGESLAEWYDSDEYQGSQQKAGTVYANYIADEPSRLLEARHRYDRDIAPLLQPHSRVLEIGCATGSLLSILRTAGHEVHGVDLSRRFIDFARQTHDLDVKLGDVLELELPVGYFDLIVALGTIANLRSVERCLDRFHRLLKSGGLLLFNFTDADSAWVRYLYRSRFWMFTPSANTFLSKRGCLAVLEKAGFSVTLLKQDYQRPSLQKLATHARAEKIFLPILGALGVANWVIPFPIPAPTVRLVAARALVPAASRPEEQRAA